VQVSDPTEDQTEKSIGAFLRTLAAGDEVAIRETQGERLRFTLTKVRDFARGRLYTEKSGHPGDAWYMRTGRSTWHPKGQSHLVEPTPGVREFIRQHGVSGAFPYRRRTELYGTAEDASPRLKPSFTHHR
jgi:hypothetical protein